MKKLKYFLIGYIVLITAFSGYVVLDALYIPKEYHVVSDNPISGSIYQPQISAETSGSSASLSENSTLGSSNSISAYSSGGSLESSSSSAGASSSQSSVSSQSSSQQKQPIVTENSYEDENIKVTLSMQRYKDTDVHIAEVILSSPEYLKTALARDVYGKNVTEKTSEMAQRKNAILAINGDYYGVRTGYCIRNGQLLRSAKAGNSQEDLAIYTDGNFEIVTEGSISAQQLFDKGARQVLSFGPGLVKNGVLNVSDGMEVGKAMTSNPRTAIAQVSPLHYIFIVSDGRTNDNKGLTLYELGELCVQLGAKTAYNLDGGGSSTMYFMGKVVNFPTTRGGYSERSVSDIVYIGR